MDDFDRGNYEELTQEPERLRLQDLPRGLRTALEGNPFYVFGLPCNARESDAKEVLHKLEPLQKLGKAHAYKPQIDLAGVEKPDREKNAMSHALSGLRHADAVWLWFRDDTWCGYEQGGTYRPRNWLSADILDGAQDYDRLLACYYSLLLHDPGLEDDARWKALLEKIGAFWELSGRTEEEFLRSRVSEEEDRPLPELRTSFYQTVLVPVLSQIETVSPVRASVMLTDPVWMPDELPFARQLQAGVNARALNWIDDAVRPLEEVQENTPAQEEELSEDGTLCIVRALDTFEKRYWPVFTQVYASLPEDSEEGKRLCEKVTNVINWLRIRIYDSDHPASAHYFSLIYPYHGAKLIQSGQWEPYFLDGYAPDELELDRSCYSDDQLVQYVRRYGSPRDAGKASQIFLDLISRGRIAGFMGRFQLYDERHDNGSALIVLRKAHDRARTHAGELTAADKIWAVSLYQYAQYLGFLKDDAYYEEMGKLTQDPQLAESLERYRQVLRSWGEADSFTELCAETARSENPYIRTLAFLLAKRAAASGEKDGLWLLANCWLSDSLGTIPNRYQAVRCYESAVKQGNMTAACEYGKYLYDGSNGFVRDRERGLELLRRAKEQGIPEAGKVLERIQRFSSGALRFRVGEQNHVRIHQEAYLNIYVHRINYARENGTVYVRMWYYNRHTLPVIVRTVLEDPRDHSKQMLPGSALTIPVGRIQAATLQVPSEDLLEQMRIRFGLQFFVVGAIPFCGAQRQLTRSCRYELQLDLYEKEAKLTPVAGTEKTSPYPDLCIPGATARRCRENNVLEIDLGSGEDPALGLEELLTKAGFVKQRFLSVWRYTYRDAAGLLEAEQLAGAVTGGYIRD